VDASAKPAHEILVDAPPGEPTMTLTRMFDAPRELVWDCFTKAEHVARWWGPHKYKITVEEFDCRPGGKWRISHSDAEKTVTFFGEYLDIEKPSRIVRTFRFAQFPPIEDTFEFHAEGPKKTRLVCKQRFPHVQARDWMANTGVKEGGQQSFERLDALLAELG